VSVVAPAYNEAAALKGLVPEIVDALDGLGGRGEVVLVDDGSDDDTAGVIDHAAQLYPRVRGVLLARNFGQSAALAAGIDAARGDVVVTMDADGQNDPGDIPALVDRLDAGADCVSGRRVDRQDPLAKRVPSTVQTYLAKWTGPDINDFGCTLTAYRAEALDDVHLYGEEHRYIPAQLYDRGYTVDEVPVEHHARENGDSHYGAGRLVRGFADLVFHLLWNRWGRRPFHLFGGVGLVLFALGLALGGGVVAGHYLLGVSLLGNLAKLLLSVGLVLFGFLLVMFGVILQYLRRLNGNERTYRVAEVVE
jgi:glycosyltransferase involved in cell wall biosynthesis